MNTMIINGHEAIIQYDAELEMFRGEYIGLNGGADFYAKDVEGLQEEGAKSLEVFFEVCKEQGIEPKKSFSGRFNMRVSPELHEKIAVASASTGKSINQFINTAIEEYLISSGEINAHRTIRTGHAKSPAIKKAAAKKKTKARNTSEKKKAVAKAKAKSTRKVSKARNAASAR